MVGAAYGHLQNQDVFHFQGESRVGESSQDTSSRSANPDMSVLNGSVGPFSPTGSFRRPGQGNTDFSQDMQQSNGASPHKIEHSQSLPAYIKALPSRFERDDITYLRNKGVLTIPDDELRNELLRNYAEYIHPFMPSIDLHTFVRSINQNDGEQPDSLLLFQAVMFSRTAIVNMDLLRAAGYNNRQEARRVFFEKVRPLYDIDYEDDSIILIQLLGQL
jgi:hypothetical protein